MGQLPADQHPGNQDEHEHGHDRILECLLEPIPLGVQVHDEQVATDNHKSKEEDSQARGAAGVGPFLAIPPKGTGARIS